MKNLKSVRRFVLQVCQLNTTLAKFFHSFAKTFDEKIIVYNADLERRIIENVFPNFSKVVTW